MPSPTPDPGNVAAELMTKIDRWLVQRYLRGSRPELKLNAVTAAPMEIAAAHRHLHRERAALGRRGGVQRTASLPHSPTAWLGAQGSFRSLSSPEGERERSPDLISRLVTDHESMVTSVQIASSREVTSPMRRSIRPKRASPRCWERGSR